MSIKSENCNDACDNDFLQKLCDDIECNITTFNSNKKTLQFDLKLIGTKEDNTELRNRMLILQQTSNSIALEITEYINKVKRAAFKDDSKPFGEQIESLENTFVEAINDYAALQQELLEKQKKFPLTLISPTELDDHEYHDYPPIDDDADEYDYSLTLASIRNLETRERLPLCELNVSSNNQKKDEVAEAVAVILDVYGILKNLGRIENDVSPDEGEASNPSNKSKRKLLILVIFAVITSSVLITIIAVLAPKK